MKALGWINPRITLILLSIAILAEASKLHTISGAIRRDCLVCFVLFALCLAVFLWPLRRTLGLRALLAPTAMLAAAWTAVALALIAEALPVSPDIQQQHPWNWPLTAFAAAAAIAFALFFENALRARRMHDDIRVARRGPRKAEDRA